MFAGVFFVLALLCFRHLPGCGSGFKVPGFAVEAPLGKLLPFWYQVRQPARERSAKAVAKAFLNTCHIAKAPSA